MSRVWAHCKRIWPRYTLFPALPLSLYCIAMAALRMLRWDHVLIAACPIVLGYAHEKTKRFLVAISGFLAIALLYDAGRFIRDLGVTESRVLNCRLYDLEKSLLGIQEGGRQIALQDYFRIHHHIAADAFFSVPYATFIALTVVYSVYLFRTDEKACSRFGWAFFALNVMGILTYHLLPAAPPWYLHKYGCAIHLDVVEYEGDALARVDALTGIGYFRGFYGRAAEVFGALPSLHVAYPLLIVLEGWRRHRWPGRGLAVFYFLWMCCAAVYLDHHWIPDLVLGWAYTLVVFVALRKLMPDATSVPVRSSGLQTEAADVTI